MNRPIQGPDGDGEGESSVSQGPSGDLKKGRQRSVGCIDENAESKSALSAKVSAVEEEKGVGESGRSPSDADKKTGESTLTETVKTESAADKRGESKAGLSLSMGKSSDLFRTRVAC